MFDKGLPSGITDFTSAIVQATLVGDSATSILLVRLNIELANLQRELMVKSGPINKLLINIDVFSRHSEDLKSEFRKIQEDMQLIQETGAAFQQRFVHLEHKAASIRSRFEDLDLKIAEFQHQLLIEQTAYFEFLFSRLPALSDANIAVMVEFRRELGIETELGLTDALVRSRESLMQATMTAIKEVSQH